MQHWAIKTKDARIITGCRDEIYDKNISRHWTDYNTATAFCAD
jgi:hypothetical protein